MVGEGCAGPPYPSMRIDHASASARSAARIACRAACRAPSARMVAPISREPKMDCRDLVLMAGNYSRPYEPAQCH